MGGILLSWPVIVALITYGLIKTGYGHQLYMAAMSTSLQEVSEEDFNQFLKTYSGHLTVQVLDSIEIQYVDTLGKTRAIQRSSERYYVSATWWRRHT